MRHVITAIALLAALLTPAAAHGATTQAAGHSPAASSSSVTAVADLAARPKKKRNKKRKVKVDLVWSATTVAVGGEAAVWGKVKGKKKFKRKRKVILQQKRSDGWKKVGATKTNGKGEFGIKVPTNWLYSMKSRVVVKKKKRSPKKATRAQRISVVPGYTPAGSKKSWSHLNPQYRLRFNPCQTITYRINVKQAPAGTDAVVHEAIATLGQATGLRFKYKGTTNAIYQGLPGTGRWQKDTDLVVSWAHPDQTKMDFTYAHAWGGTDKAVWGRDARGRVGKIVRGGTVFDATTPGGWPRMKALDVLLHELGHAVGLGHVSDPTQIMASGVEGPYVYGAGDLNGLNKLGKQTGCVRKARTRRGDLPSPESAGLHVAMP